MELEKLVNLKFLLEDLKKEVQKVGEEVRLELANKDTKWDFICWNGVESGIDKAYNIIKNEIKFRE
tara:strand:- start:68 stop:265 length:198 start_codon:yes stop_codon:yes gene_type:complete